MKLEALFDELHAQQIELGLVQGKLKVLDPHGRLNDELKSQLSLHKQALITVLSGQLPLSAVDFPEARLTPAQLQQISLQYADIADIWSVTPLQAGMLFHGLEDAGASYTNMNFCVLKGQLDVSAFEQAWQQLVHQIPAFRSQFFIGDDGVFHQVITTSARLTVQWHNWCDKTAAQQQLDLQQLMQDERKQGFDLGKAPLMRIQLIQLQPEQYYFVWAQHHAIADGWSRPLIFNAFLSCYEALRHQKPLPVLAFGQYKNYLRWLLARDPQVAGHYWQSYLAGFVQNNALHIDTLPLSAHSSGFDNEYCELSKELTEQLKVLSRREARTMNSLFQAAWALLLHRYSGDADLVFGTTVSGRPAEVPDIERMIGMFLNTLPVRVRIQPESTLRQLVEQTHSASLDAGVYGFLGLGDIQRQSGFGAGSALFDTLVVYQNFPDALYNPTLHSEVGFCVQGSGSAEHTAYKLLFNIFDTESLAIRVTYSRNVFAATTVRRLLQHLQGVLQAMAIQGLDQRLAGIPLAGQQIARLDPVTTQPVVAEPALRLNELFERQVQQTPAQLALICGRDTLTYQQLNERSNQLARALIRRGVRTGTRVGIGMPRSANMLVALLAVMKAGGTYVPLDAKLPVARLQFMVRDADISLILCHQSQLGIYQQCGAAALALDCSQLLTECCGDSAENLTTQPATAQDLIYVLYTSGSTGQPKGVQVEHRSLCNYLQQLKLFLSGSEIKGSLVSSPLLFDGTVSTLYLPLLSGLYVELLDADETDLVLLADYLLDDDAALLFKLTPSHLVALQHYLTKSQPAARHLIMVAGEQFPAPLALHWSRQLLPCCRFFNEYGPTEISVAATIYEVNRQDDQLQSAISVPIGQPFATYLLYVLDTEGHETAIGVPGELYIGGPGVARGYLNRPELTAERFILLTLPGQQPQRVYKTGDKVRWLESGQLEFLGRMDFQLKLRGVRIEPGETEHALLNHPEVTQAQVLLCQRHDAEQLVAFVVADTVAPSQRVAFTEALRQLLLSQLPLAQVPAEFVVCDALPLNTNGKVDRLQLLESWLQTMEHEVIGAQSGLEQQLLQIWQSTLSKTPLSVTDDFFRHGGHSLLVMKVLSEIRQQLGYVVTVREFFHFPTVRTLANYLQRLELNRQLDSADMSMIEEGEI